jgi:hypothetical protein
MPQSQAVSCSAPRAGASGGGTSGSFKCCSMCLTAAPPVRYARTRRLALHLRQVKTSTLKTRQSRPAQSSRAPPLRSPPLGAVRDAASADSRPSSTSGAAAAGSRCGEWRAQAAARVPLARVAGDGVPPPGSPRRMRDASAARRPAPFSSGSRGRTTATRRQAAASRPALPVQWRACRHRRARSRAPEARPSGGKRIRAWTGYPRLRPPRPAGADGLR